MFVCQGLIYAKPKNLATLPATQAPPRLPHRSPSSSLQNSATKHPPKPAQTHPTPSSQSFVGPQASATPTSNNAHQSPTPTPFPLSALLCHPPAPRSAAPTTSSPRSRSTE